MQKKILVVDDEKNIVNIISFNLKKEGFEVISAKDGAEGVKKAMEFSPDLILLDIMMPNMDGYEACKQIRLKSNVPIIMLTARAEEVDKVLGLELGADDYVTKPFSVRELIARVKANLRRQVVDINASIKPQSEPVQIQTVGALTVNFDKYEVKKNGEILELTHREFEFLKFLVEQEEQVFSREVLLENVWGYEAFGDARTVDVTVRRLREKIEDDPGKPTMLLTKRGVGYYFNGK